MPHENQPRVDLIFEATCPNVDLARSRLRSAFFAAAMWPRWNEWAEDGVDTPDEFRGLGSPTILVNGKDVSPSKQEPAAGSCRLYRGADGGLDRAPSVLAIVEKLLTTA